MSFPFSRRINVTDPLGFARPASWQGPFVSPPQSDDFSSTTDPADFTPGVPAGVPVTLAVFYAAQAGRSTAVHHRIKDRTGTVLADVVINQTQPTGALGLPIVNGTDPTTGDPNATSQDGTPQIFVQVGTVTVPDSYLTLEIQGDGGGYAIADTLLVLSSQPIPAPPQPAQVSRAAVGTAGRLVALYLVDLAGNPSVLTAVDAAKTPVVRVNGTPVATSAPVWGSASGQPQLSHAVLRMTSPVGATDVVTLDVVDSWCTTAAGVCGAAAGIAATNLVGGSIRPAFVAGPKTMQVGMNVSNPKDTYAPMFTNLARGLEDWTGNVAADFTADEAGSIASMGSNTDISCRVVGGFNNPGDASQTYLPCLPGVYTLGYATGAAYTLDGNGAPTTIVSGPTDDGLGTTTIVYLFGQSAPHYGPVIDLHCASPGVLKHIHPPDPAAPTARSVDGSSEWYPQFTDKLAGFKVARFMDWLGTNNSNVYQFSDFTPDATLSFSRLNNRNMVASVVRIEPYTDTANRYAGGLYGVLILVTTSAPHGLPDGPIQNGTLGGFRGPGEPGPTYAGVFPTVSPADTVALNGALSILDVLSPTTFIVRARATINTQAVLAGTYTSADFGAGATVTVRNRIGASPASAFRLCAATGLAPWLNAPTGASDTCLWDPADPTNSLFGLAFSILPDTSTLWIEYGNEIWNFNFLQFSTATINGNVAGQSLIQWVTHRTAAVHALAAAAKAALGWGGTLRFVYSHFATDLGVAHASGYPLDHVCINNYWLNQPYSDAFAATYAGYTHADRMDLYDFYLTDSDMARTVKAWSDALRPLYPAASPVVYEGAAASGLLFAADSGVESRRWARDPAQYHAVRAVMQVLQDNGCSLFNWFNFSGALRDNGATSYACYFNCDQTDGTGDPSENAAFDDFATNPVSQVGGALKAWNALLGGAGAAVLRRIFESAVFRSNLFRRRSA